MSLIGSDTSLAEAPAPVQSDDAIKRKRLLAEALMKEGMDYSPIRHPFQGAARLAQALVGGWEARQADQAEEANNNYNSELMKGFLSSPATAEGNVTPAPAMLTPSAPAASAVGNPAPVAAKSDLLPAFAQAGSRWGVSPGYLTRTAQIESGMDPNAKNASGAAGLMQFVPKTAKAYNLFNPFDANASIDAAGHLAADNKKVLVASLGRQPSDAELYLAHQQGAGGAAKLLANPNAPAESIVGRQAVLQNGGKPGMTAGQFAGLWLNKFGGTPAGGGTQVADSSGAVPASAAPAQNGQAQRLLAAMADPRLSPQNKQILTMMYKNAVGGDNGAHRHVVNGALVDDSGNVLYKGETKPDPKTELQRDLEYVQTHPEAKPYFEKKYGQSNSLLDQAEQRKQLIQQQGGNPNDPRTQQFINTGRYPREDAQPLTPTDKKAILEADELVQSNESAIQALNKAKEVSKSAYGGWGAGARAQIGLNAPDWLVPDRLANPDTSAQTQDLENIVIGNALNSLKSTFGGNPTEGERAILLQLQGSVGQPDAVRQKIYDRAIEMAQRRLEFNRKRASDLRGQQYYEPGHNPDVPHPQGGEELQAAREAIARGKDKNAVIQRLREHGIDPAGL